MQQQLRFLTGSATKNDFISPSGLLNAKGDRIKIMLNGRQNSLKKHFAGGEMVSRKTELLLEISKYCNWGNMNTDNGEKGLWCSLLLKWVENRDAPGFTGQCSSWRVTYCELSEKLWREMTFSVVTNVY